MFPLQIRGLETGKVWDMVQTLSSQEGRQNIHPLMQKVTKKGFVLNGYNLLLTTNQLILIVDYALCLDFCTLESVWQEKVTYGENQTLRADQIGIIWYLLRPSVLPLPLSLPLSAPMNLALVQMHYNKRISTLYYQHSLFCTLSVMLICTPMNIIFK